MNTLSITVNGNANSTATELRVKKDFLNELLSILPLCLSSILTGIKTDKNDIVVLSFACQEDEYFEKLA